ncbi:MAG: tRNA (adenosine(37)-N6)-threonylcarbamoyltransferase complex ATPase subunit type 1 TsaE [Candidatus Dormibacteria bacterium]
MKPLATTVRCSTERETLALGERIGRVLEPGDLIVLTGPLGAGKTVMVRGIAVGTGADPRTVRSPTFVFHHVYPGAGLTLHHLDLYRLGANADHRFLDIAALLEEGGAVVEWGELADLRRFQPTVVTLSIAGDSSRLIALADGAPLRVVTAWCGDDRTHP